MQDAEDVLSKAIMVLKEKFLDKDACEKTENAVKALWGIVRLEISVWRRKRKDELFYTHPFRHESHDGTRRVEEAENFSMELVPEKRVMHPPSYYYWKERREMPENIAKKRIYQRSEEYKVKRRAYQNSPEYKEKANKRRAIYRAANPEKYNTYLKNWRKKHKVWTTTLTK